jgi:hypothetical protein
MSLLKGSKMLKTKSEIKKKLEQAEEAIEATLGTDNKRLDGVISSLRWVLGVKITQEPQDPVTEE